MVSRLSGHLRRRLITEDEVISAVLARHSFSAVENLSLKYIVGLILRAG